jgi:Cu/Ag efflux protein CusF
VVGVDAARGRVTLKHAPIKSIKMAAMTMRFKVADASMLTPYKVGDRVRFAVVLQDDELIVSHMERSP